MRYRYDPEALLESERIVAADPKCSGIQQAIARKAIARLEKEVADLRKHRKTPPVQRSMPVQRSLYGGDDAA